MRLLLTSKVAGQLSTVLFIVAVPLFLITISVTWAVNDLRLYRYGFEEYNVSIVTGIDQDELMTAARQIRGYFNSTREPLDIRANVFGEDTELFSQREVIHMRDVKHLIWGVYGVAAASGLYLIGFTAAGFAFRRGNLAHTLSRLLLSGSALTIVLVAFVGLFSLVGFDSLFTKFHELSFANDFWKLNANRDYLVMMFPQGFWFDATLFVGLGAVGGALVIAAITGGFLILERRQTRRQQQTVLQNPSTLP